MMRVRSMLVSVHLWLGLLAAPVLVVVGLTGALLTLEELITDRLDHAIWVVDPARERQPISALQASVQQRYPDARLLGVQLPPDARHAIALPESLSSRSRRIVVLVNPYTARVLGTDADQSTFFRYVRQAHRQLLTGKTGSLVVTWAAVILAVLAITGPALWWPRRRTGVRWTTGGWRRTLDLHSVIGAASYLFLLAFAVTGVVVHWDDAVQRILSAVTGAPLPQPRQTIVGGECDPAVADPDRLIEAAAAALPGARPTSLRLPSERGSLARVQLRFPEDGTPNGRSAAMLDPCTGRVVSGVNTRSAPLAYVAPRVWNRAIHTGDMFGWPGRAVAFLFALSLPAMAITGPLVWLARRRRMNARTGVRSAQHPSSLIHSRRIVPPVQGEQRLGG